VYAEQFLVPLHPTFMDIQFTYYDFLKKVRYTFIVTPCVLLGLPGFPTAHQIQTCIFFKRVKFWVFFPVLPVTR